MLYLCTEEGHGEVEEVGSLCLQILGTTEESKPTVILKLCTDRSPKAQQKQGSLTPDFSSPSDIED